MRQVRTIVSRDAVCQTRVRGESGTMRHREPMKGREASRQLHKSTALASVWCESSVEDSALWRFVAAVVMLVL